MLDALHHVLSLGFCKRLYLTTKRIQAGVVHTGEFDWLAGLKERSKIESRDLWYSGQSLHELVCLGGLVHYLHLREI